MANVPYSEGVGQVEPSARVPGDDYQHISTEPGQFGGFIAQGVEQLGQGETKAAQFFGKVAADNASNDYQDRVDKILHGDPAQTMIGPDGKPQPMPGYLALKGRAALDAWPKVSEQLNSIRDDIRKGLSSPDQQLEFDNFTRRYKSFAVGQMGTHADREANTWYQAVNGDTARLALTHIAMNADNPEELAHGTSDLINARVKQAEIAGAQPGDVVWKQTIAEAKRDALEAQLNAVAVHDPLRATRILEKNKETAGLKYDDMANRFRARAEKQQGDEVGTDALRKTYDNVPPTERVYPALDQIGARYGISSSFLQRTWQLEASGKLHPEPSVTGAQGPFQFTGTTARRMGVQNPNDFYESADGTARLAVENKQTLRLGLGRPPTDAELYLAHQQGGAGATALLTNPDMPAADALAPYYKGGRAEAALRVRQNGGNPEAPSSDFTSMWVSKYNGATAAMSMSRKAAAYQTITERNDIPEAVRDHAISRVNRDITMQMQALEATSQARKLQNDAAADGYVTRMLKGNPVSVDEIGDDNKLSWETKVHLKSMIESMPGGDIEKAKTTYGSGYWGAYKAIMAGEDDPGRIHDFTQIMALAGPDADPNRRVTTAGVERLGQLLREKDKSIDTHAVERAKLGLLNYAKSKLSFEQDTGPIKIRDPKGEQLFSGTFIPKFEKSFNDWVQKGGKDPWEFLTKDKIDEMVKGMRSSSEMAIERMNAMGESTAGAPSQPMPPAPTGVDANAWAKVMARLPVTENGTKFSPAAWSTAVNMLLANPSPEVIKQFNASKFGKQGFDASEILRSLKPDAAAAPPAAHAPAKEPEKAKPAYSIHDESGPGPAGYLGDLIRSATPQAVQDYVASKGH